MEAIAHAGLLGAEGDAGLALRCALADLPEPKTVVRIALAHKLLVRLDAKARDIRQDFAIAA